MKGKSRAKSDRVQQEREHVLLAGDAGATEYMRRIHAGAYGGYSEAPIYTADVQRRRYAQGGTHDRLHNAAMRDGLLDVMRALHECEYRCFIGRGRYAKRYKYEG